MEEERNHKIAILGPGAWGTALGKLLAEKGNEVLFYGNQPDYRAINEIHENPIAFPGVKLPISCHYTESMEEALKEAEVIIFAIPSKAYRAVAQQAGSILLALRKKVHIISLGKGFDGEKLERLSDLLREAIPEECRYPIVSLLGPSFASEVMEGRVTCLNAVSLDLSEASFAQRLLSGPSFRAYALTDEVGAEVGAALKNVIAIAGGIAAGLGEGENAKAALITRGEAEIVRFGMKLGAKRETFFGLSGIGDLILTCSSRKSRNYNLGYLIGQYDDAERAMKENRATVEGVVTSEYILKMAERLGVEMPLCAEVHAILSLKEKPSVGLAKLMGRSLKVEKI